MNAVEAGRELAVIAAIQKIESIEGYDRVVLATIENYPVIVRKDEYKEGDLCVYVYYDTLLPVRPEFEFLRKSSYSPKYNAFRIRNMKLCGKYSSGLALPLSVLPKDFKPIKAGVEVSEVLGITKYDPELAGEQLSKKQVKGVRKFIQTVHKAFMRCKLYRKLVTKIKRKIAENNLRAYPDTVSKSNETNIEKIWGNLMENHSDREFYVTEKLEGQAATYMLYGKRRKYYVFSHNVYRPTHGNGSWEEVGRKFELEDILRSVKDQNLAIQGEIVGPGIQKNIYGLPALDFYVYKVVDTVTGIAYNYQELREFVADHGLKMVPVLEDYVKITKFKDVNEMLADSDGNSRLFKDAKREGVVWRAVDNQDVGCKVKSRDYQLWFSGNKQGEE